ncbi:hypothetical protein [Winogradskya humida]|uniref:ArsR family transcriptional regulator n=1 Tax=Winogradskya humida TaxID=113566 RepID=A0ABQ4A3Y0_9ACTN|nr:hypothetical protein [Actinoplanes humidus]GIE25313.1 hypothetical protein Ahu01nite_084150 [Actinoplanes humidus]
MTRQSATQHLELLEGANLISVVRRGRAKLHYLNPVPLHEMQERWIDKFERPRLRALSGVKIRAEKAMSDRPTYVYVTYIESTPERAWHALTDADLTGCLLGARQRLRLAARFDVGAPTRRRVRDRRRGGHGRGGVRATPARHDVGRSGPAGSRL